MSSNKNTVRYKQTTRQTRIQTREGEFSGGMFFTDKPQTTGYSKLLVNYDINHTDGTLRTRRGLQSKSTISGGEVFSIDWLGIGNYQPHIIGSHVREHITKDGEKTRTLSSLVYEPFSGSTYLLQCPDPSQVNNNWRYTNIDGSKKYMFGGQYTQTALSEGKKYGRNNMYDDYYQIETTTIVEPEIHSQKVITTIDQNTRDYYFRKPVGTFAFGDSYYFFSHLTYPLKSPFAVLESSAFSMGTGIAYNVTGAPDLVACLDPDTGIIFPGYWDRTDETNIKLYPYTNPIPAGSTLTMGIDQTKKGYTGTYYNPSTSSISIPLPSDGKVSMQSFMETFYLALTKPLYSWEEDGEIDPKFKIRTRDEYYLGESCRLTGEFYYPTRTVTIGNSSTTYSYGLKSYICFGYRSINSVKAKIYPKEDAGNIVNWVPDVTFTESPELHYLRATENSTDIVATHRNRFSSNYMDRINTQDYIITPQTQNPSEAASAGYNMLLENPYAFACESGANINILGILPYSNGQLSLTPVINKDLTLKCFYRAPITNKEYRVVWEWREVGATTWNTIKDEKINFSTLNLSPLTCDFRSAVEQLILRVTISDPSNKVTQSDGSEIEYVETTTALGLNFIIAASTSRQNVQPIHYNLGTAKGMLEWKNRLVLWGVKDAAEMLFTSDVNNPTFFPYPNNVDVLDEPIIHCMLYGDDLVVFTTTRLYRLTFDESGITWNRSLIQKDLQIAERDVSMFCRIKNMLLFKSGNYYYMLVPKSTSITGETTIAPISNNMRDFFDHFPDEIEKLFKIMSQDLKPRYNSYNKITDFLCNYYSYVDNQSVVLNYIYNINNYYVFEDQLMHFNPYNNRFWQVSLIYDTENYTWRIHTMVIPFMCYPILTNALAQRTFMHLIPENNSNGKWQPQLIYDQFGTDAQDNLITLDYYSQGNQGPYYDYLTPRSDTDKDMLLKNYQYLDTGYRKLTSSVDLKKRFREVQFSINNISQKALTFYTSFILDGQLRRDMQGYNTKVILDPTDPRTGILLVERPYIDPRFLPSVPEFTVSIKDYINPDVTPGDTTLDDSFVLDNTKFPDLAYWKVRISVSGKGYTPRLQVLSTNDLDYSILSTNWIYRTMNSR